MRIRIRIRPLLTIVTLLTVVVAGLPAQAAWNRPVDSQTITRKGAALMLHYRPYRFAGVNAYSLATLWSHNAGCGGQVDDLDGFFASLPRNSVVRFWAFQSMAVNTTTREIDFTALDRVVRSAERQRQRLVLTLGTQDGGCDDGHWRDAAWYAGGYATPYDDTGRAGTRLSYLDWVRTIVPRYAGSRAVGAWELINEPEAADCPPGRTGSQCYGAGPCPPTATAALRGFYDVVGGVVHQLDRRHLVMSGVLGGDQCGIAGDGYRVVHASPGIDVATFHDYGHDTTPLPPHLRLRLEQAQSLGKPLVVGEVGIVADGPGCMSARQRSGLLLAKRDAAGAAGADGFLPWSWVQDDTGRCGHDLRPDDPYLTALRQGS